jgi:hypothetical protein
MIRNTSHSIQRDYYKNFAEQLQLENSKKWRLQERDDWKALVDSVQKDRIRLQEECNKMERELTSALDEIDHLQRIIADSKSQINPDNGDDSSSSGMFTISPNIPVLTTPVRNAHIAVGDTEGEPTSSEGKLADTESTPSKDKDSDHSLIGDPNGDFTEGDDDISAELNGKSGSADADNSRESKTSSHGNGNGPKEIIDKLTIAIPSRKTTSSTDSPSRYSVRTSSPSECNGVGRARSVDSGASTPAGMRSIMSPTIAGLDTSQNGRISRSGTVDGMSSPSPTGAVRDLRMELATVTADVSALKLV